MAFTNGISEHRRQEVRQAIDNACDQMRAEGVHPLYYAEQLSWLFFLKAFEETENRREQEASFDQEPYQRRLDGEYRWSEWSKQTDRPDEMLQFVNTMLWPKLRGDDPKNNLGDDALAQRFKRIFSEVKNYQNRGASFARVVVQVDKLHFNERTDVIVLSEIYEGLLKDVAQVAGYAGEFYTPRHIIRTMIKVVRPCYGDKVYDPCFGSAGFLSESADEITRNKGNWSADELKRFHDSTFYGRELRPLAYLMGTMGLILHDVHSPNLELINTLEVHSNDIAEKDKYSVILANPPYGGKLQSQSQTNFTVRSGSTEVLFLQHIMKNLAKGGRAAVVVPEGVLFRGGPDKKVRERLLTEFNVHTILSLPSGSFLPYTPVKTNIIFFNREDDERGTQDIWYYELTNDGFELKQTRKPMDGDQNPDFLSKWIDRIEGDNSWIVSIDEVRSRDWDLSAKNPKRKDSYEERPAIELLHNIKTSEQHLVDLLEELEQLLREDSHVFSNGINKGWEIVPIGQIAEKLQYGYTQTAQSQPVGPKFLRITDIQEGVVNWNDVPYCECGERNLDKFKLLVGDILFARTGATTGKSFLIKEIPETAVFASYLIRLTLRESVLQDFVYHFFQSPDYWSQIRSKSRGGAQPNINARMLSDILIPIPSSLDEQKEVVVMLNAALGKIQYLFNEYREAGKKIGLLRDSVLQTTFTRNIHNGND